ncbi:unnamed protein product [Fusarium graminearum]|uniref:Uncharacterized protein n=1 Tax=Gibberella zeae TaxID=5518 RepID=A0A8H3JE94_GIBZA|nr:unnamed protein product [Fusarium graminearum]CAG1968755.1 unnamed protein product [Fusarium graminearum]CAG2002235.1 unnamed protein product [Fusarium graminearum]
MTLTLTKPESSLPVMKQTWNHAQDDREPARNASLRVPLDHSRFNDPGGLRFSWHYVATQALASGSPSDAQ